MHCPRCQETLILSDRLGIEIDYCPKCRGIWLDRGELEKLIERSSLHIAPQPITSLQDARGTDRDSRQEPYVSGTPAKRASWLSRILDFD